VAVLQGDSAVGYIPRESSRVALYFLRHGGEITCEITGRWRGSNFDAKGLEVPCVYRFLKMPRDSQCQFPGNMSIKLAVFKATTVTKEFSKCHSKWRFCPFPRIVSYLLLQSQESCQRLLKT